MSCHAYLPCVLAFDGGPCVFRKGKGLATLPVRAPPRLTIDVCCSCHCLSRPYVACTVEHYLPSVLQVALHGPQACVSELSTMGGSKDSSGSSGYSYYSDSSMVLEPEADYEVEGEGEQQQVEEISDTAPEATASEGTSKSEPGSQETHNMKQVRREHTLAARLYFCMEFEDLAKDKYILPSLMTEIADTLGNIRGEVHATWQFGKFFGSNINWQL
eukprot:3415746-Amphidinium_carterae.4